jgi:phosphohistidine phosphatase
MKTLYLLRHAKSSWDYNVEDRNRPLQAKGIRRIQKVAQAQRSAWKSLDALFSSPANRAMHTAVIAATQADFPVSKIQLATQLYSFDAQAVLHFIYDLPKALNTVLLVGHNPAFTSVANHLGADSCPELKTASWACITFAETEWGSISNGTLNWGITSKEDER